MSAASRDRIGSTPGGDDLIANTLRKGLRKGADPPIGERMDPPADTPAPADADGITDARTGTPARDSVEAHADGPTDAPGRQPGGPETLHTGEAMTGPQKPAQGPRRILEVKARAYRGGWERLRPRAEALAEAIRAVLDAGGTASEVRGLLTEVGVPTDAVPTEAKEALRRR